MSGPATWPHVTDFGDTVPDVAFDDDIALLNASLADWRSAANIAHTLALYEGECIAPLFVSLPDPEYAESGR